MTSDATHLLTLLKRRDGKIKHRAKLHEPSGRLPVQVDHPAASGSDQGRAKQRAGAAPGRFPNAGLCAGQRR